MCAFECHIKDTKSIYGIFYGPKLFLLHISNKLANYIFSKTASLDIGIIKN